jgi:ATP-binding cassette subfamily B (MDR/TAP) protein 1
MSLVLQDAILYEGNVAWNVSLGALDPSSVTHDDLGRACREVNILEFVQSLPESFETQVGLKGYKVYF